MVQPGRIILVLVTLLGTFGMWPRQGDAGAWPRENGQAFLASSVRLGFSELANPSSAYSAAYLEYGLGRDYTAGLDIGHGISGKTKAILFFRRKIAEPRQGHLFAPSWGLA